MTQQSKRVESLADILGMKASDPKFEPLVYRIIEWFHNCILEERNPAPPSNVISFKKRRH